MWASGAWVTERPLRTALAEFALWASGTNLPINSCWPLKTTLALFALDAFNTNLAYGAPLPYGSIDTRRPGSTDFTLDALCAICAIGTGRTGGTDLALNTF